MRKAVILMLSVALAAGMTMGLGCGGGGGNGSSTPFLAVFTGNVDPAFIGTIGSPIDTSQALNLGLAGSQPGVEALKSVKDETKIILPNGIKPLAAEAVTLAEPCEYETESGFAGTIIKGLCLTDSGDVRISRNASNYADTPLELYNGYVDVVTDYNAKFLYSFDGWAYWNSISGKDYIFYGTVKANRAGSTLTASFNLVVVHRPGAPDEEMSYLRKYVMTVVDRTTHNEISISGRYYHDDDGYVDISTQKTILMIPDSPPYDGILRLTGAQGNYIEMEFGEAIPLSVLDPSDPDALRVIVEILGDGFDPNWVTDPPLYWADL
jgi:hypothetical protein